MLITQRLFLAGVLILTAAVFSPALFLGFNSFWDLYYVHENPFQRPLTPAVFRAAFVSFLEGNYHPLTLLSHSLDFTFWSFIPFGHHLASYLLHLLNVLLVFLLVEEFASRAAAARPAEIAALAALIFGLHPLRVESVVWVTERKDVLFAFFYLLSLLCFIRWRLFRREQSSPYSLLPTPNSPLPTPHLTWGWYLSSIALCACSLLSKAMAVSFPLVVCLLDHDLLSGPGERSWKRSSLRALPFALVAALGAYLAVQGQSRSLLMAPISPAILLRNLGEFPVVLFFYIGRTVWPLHLAPIYPIDLYVHPLIPAAAWLGALGTLAVALVFRRRHPAFLTLFLLTVLLLLPAGGIVRVGAQILADRFSLLPMLPVAVALAGLISVALRRPAAGKAVAVILFLWLGFLAGKTVTYASLWDDAVALTQKAYDLYPDSPVIEDFLLGSYNNSTFDLIARGRFDEAVERYRRALAINPDFAVIRRNLGLVYLRQEKYSAAVEEFAASIRSRPQFIEAYHDLARAWKLLGKPAEAISVLAEGADKNPSAVSLRAALGFGYLEEGLPGAASSAFGEALSLDPSSAAVKRGLAAVQRMGERK